MRLLMHEGCLQSSSPVYAGNAELYKSSCNLEQIVTAQHQIMTITHHLRSVDVAVRAHPQNPGVVL